MQPPAGRKPRNLHRSQAPRLAGAANLDGFILCHKFAPPANDELTNVNSVGSKTRGKWSGRDAFRTFSKRQLKDVQRGIFFALELGGVGIAERDIDAAFADQLGRGFGSATPTWMISRTWRKGSPRWICGNGLFKTLTFLIPGAAVCRGTRR